MSSLQNISSKKDQENWEIEIKAEITPEALTRYRGEALKDLTKTVQLKGFRAGHAPESEIIRHVGEAEIMRRAADMAVRNELPELLAKEQANIVDSPQVTVDVPKPNEPLGFTARAPLAPEITLPDYKKIAAETNLKRGKPEVTEKETKETLQEVLEILR